MCGRYHVDHEMVKEMDKIIRQTDKKQGKESLWDMGKIVPDDICPGKDAPILSGKGGAIHCQWQRWGFPINQEQSSLRDKKLVFNARCESALERPLFRESVRHRRIAVPAAWFYEWNSEKEKNTFRRKERPVLFMAGFCRQYEDGEHFVILTTAANESMEPVHDRMPLILEQEEIADWILDDTKAEDILRKVPCLLERETDYEQMSLF